MFFLIFYHSDFRLFSCFVLVHSSIQVEISQDQWLSENDLLSKELEQALLLNQDLNDEVNELKHLLQLRERQLVFISGVLPGYEDF